MDALKHMSEYDPEGAKAAEEQIWAEFVEASGGTREELEAAYKRVHLDGYYGPIADSEAALEGLPSMANAERRDPVRPPPLRDQGGLRHGGLRQGAGEHGHLGGGRGPVVEAGREGVGDRQADALSSVGSPERWDKVAMLRGC